MKSSVEIFAELAIYLRQMPESVIEQAQRENSWFSHIDVAIDAICSKLLDRSALVDDQVVTLKNCSVNGVKITAENWTSLVAPESTCGEGQISVELKNGSYLTAENVVDYIVFE